MERHLTPPEIEAWVHGRLAGEDRERCAEHVAACETCGEAAAAARRDEALLDELRSVVREPAGDVRDPASVGEVPSAIGTNAFPGYELEEELHRGGQGAVYQARERATDRRVALKVLLRGRHASTRDLLRFEREIELASRLRHPDIVEMLASGIADGLPWFAMELVDGRRLDEHVAAAGLDLGKKLRLFARVAEAVAAAHRRGVIHRDLKPGNILVDAAGNPRVLDFGVAKALGEDEGRRLRVTATGEFLGTLAYAAPEQVAGDPDEVDTRTDVYALGLLLYEMLTGRLPYPVTGRVSEVVHAITRTPPADPRVFAPEVDTELALVIATALAKEPAERYPSAEALARDVRHYLAKEPIEAKGKSIGYVLRKGLARHRSAVAAVAAVLLVLGAGAFVLVRERLRAERRTEEAELVRELMQDVLGAAAPDRMGSDVTVLEVYGEAAERIETALVDSPDAQAALHLTIGDTYRRLFEFEDAVSHLEKALERYRRSDAGGLELARCLHVTGLCLAESQRDPVRALALHEEALALRRAALPAEDPLVAESERGLAIALLSQYSDQDDRRAAELLYESLARLRAALGDDHPDVAETKLWLGRLARRDGDEAGAERLFLDAIAVLEDAPDPRIVDALLAYSSLLRGQRRFDEAEAALARSSDVTKRLYGDHRSVELLRNRSRLFIAKRDFATAEELLREAVVQELERWSRQRPEDAERIGTAQDRLRVARPPASEPRYAEAFGILREYRGNGAFELVSWINDITDTLREQDRGAAAEPLLEEALEIHCRAFGADCPIRMEALLNLARVRFESDRPGEAVALVEEVLATMERTGEAGSKEAAEARELLRRCREGAARRI